MSEESSQAETAQAKDKPAHTFSADYVKELREEAKTYRLKMEAAEKAAQSASDAAKKAGEDADGKVSEATTRLHQRLIQAELKTAAVKAGIVDLDGLRLVDTKDVALNDEGEVEGAEELISRLKDAKPYLFADKASRGTTTNTSPAPKPAEAKAKSALDMTPEEYRAERTRFLKTVGR